MRWLLLAASWLVANSSEGSLRVTSEGPLGGAVAALGVMPVTLGAGASCLARWFATVAGIT